MKAVLFDFDGVLVNTLLMCFEISQELYPHISYENYINLHDGNVYQTFASIGAGDHSKFHTRYSTHLSKYNIHEDLKNLIEKLSQTTFLGIVSSGSGETIQKHLVRENVDQFFTDVLGYEFHTNKTHKILHILDTHKIEAEDTIFITDTLGDLLEGNKAGVQTIGVTWGWHDRATLAKGNPKHIVDTVGELKDILLV